MKRRIKIIYLIGIFIAFTLVIFALKYHMKSAKSKEDTSLNISFTRINDVLNRNITDRKIVLRDMVIFIGTSEKEIDNGYYDVKIYKENDIFKIHINKLWKEYNDELYEDKYLDELVYSISHIFEISNVSCLKDKLLFCYKEAKKVDIVSEDYKIGTVKDNNLKIEFEIKNKELILLVCKGVDDEK